MMAQNSTVSLTLKLAGNAGAELKKISDQQIQATTKVNQNWTQIGTAQARFVNTAKAGTQATVNTAKASDNLLRTNRMLEGVLRQQSIQTKLQSQNLKQQKQSAQQLASWMKQVEQSSKRTQQNTQQTSSLWQKGAAVTGAVVGAGLALQQPIKRTVDYDRDLHYAAQKLSDSPADWQSSKKWMNSIVVGNAVNGGVSRDTSFLAMDALLADGAYNDTSPDKMKSNLAKAHYEAAKSALASGGDILDFANVGLAAKKRGLDEARVQAMVIKADDLGAMSASDIAKALPAQLGRLPIDKSNGERQVAQLIALNEIAMNTAGGSGEADTNVQNFLGKMYSFDTIERLKKKHKINLPRRYADGKNQNKTDFDVFSEVVNEIVAKDKNSQNLVAKIKAAKNDSEKLAVLETQQAIFEQSGLAEILPDMQALMGLVATQRYGGNWESLTNTALTQGEQTRDTKYQYNKDNLAAFGVNAFDVTRKNAEYQTLESTVQQLGNMGTKVAELTEQYPGLITAMGTAELALKTLAAAAGGAALGNIFTGGGGKGSTAGKIFNGAKGAGGAAVRFATNPVVAAGAAGYGVGTIINKTMIEGTDFGHNLGGAIATIWQHMPDWMGGDTAREALEAEMNYLSGLTEQQNQKSDQQIQLNSQLVKEMQAMRQEITGIANRPLSINGGSLLDTVSGSAQKESQRHGAVPFFLRPQP